MRRIPVLLCADVEPADRFVRGRAGDEWPGVREITDWCGAARPRLESATGRPVHFNWFIRCDPQVEKASGSATWAMDTYAATWKRAEAAGDEIGIHVHAYRWEDADAVWIIDHGNQPWVNHCIASSADAFERAFSRRPASIRFGDHFLNSATVALIDRMGFRYDLTPEPGQPPAQAMVEGERATGTLPDYRAMPREMYRPSRLNYLSPGRWLRRRLWIVPVSTGCVTGPVRYEWTDSPGPQSSLNLILDPPFFSRIMDGLLAQLQRPHLVIVVRTGDWDDAAQRANIQANLAFIASHPRLPEFSFATPAEAVTP